MKVSAVLVALCASGSMATTYSKGGAKLCPDGLLYNSVKCCSGNLLNILGLDCVNPSKYPTSASNFKSVCGSRQATCCTAELLELGVICNKAIGTN